MERRKAIRAPLRVPVRYSVQVSTKGENSSLSRDVSPNGLGIMLAERVPQGTPVTLDITLPGNQQDITAQGKVVWQSDLKEQASARPSLFATGIHYTRINKASRNQLADFISRSLKQQSQEADRTVRSLLDEERTPKPREHLFQKRVFLTDTNAEGNVYFSRYFDWQGMAREDFFRSAVPDHLEILQAGTKLITVHAWIKYEHESHLFDEILIKVQTVSLKKMSMELGFTFVNQRSGQVIAIGGQKLAFADPTGKLILVPPSIRAGAATCLVEPNTEVWHMELIKKQNGDHERQISTPERLGEGKQ